MHEFDTIKKPTTNEKYTLNQIKEIAKCENDPLYFIENYIHIQHPVKGSVPLILYDYQKQMIDNFNNHRFNILMVFRQAGKTTIAASYLLWKAMYTSDHTILIVANKLSQAIEIMDRIRYSYENIYEKSANSLIKIPANYLKAGITEYNKTTIKFDNGSKIVCRATTADAGRGLSPSCIYADEFAFTGKIGVEFWNAMLPTISTGGSCIITSTPNTDTDLFYTLWKDAINIYDEYGNENKDRLGINNFKAFKAVWTDHPDRNEEWAKPFRSQLGEDGFRREFCCLSFDTNINVQYKNGKIDQLSIGNLYNIFNYYNETIFYGNQKKLTINSLDLKILTNTGYKKFAGISYMGEKKIYKLKFVSGIEIECTNNHIFIDIFNKEIFAKDLMIGKKIKAKNKEGYDIISDVFDTNKISDVYDIIEVDGNVFYANEILCHNCEFISFEETLINNLKLKEIKATDELFKINQIRWYDEIKANNKYIVTLDPSAGTGGDYAAIQVYEIPTMKQIAEWMHNKTTTIDQVKILKDVLNYIYWSLADMKDQVNDPEIYWSFENNSLGESIILAVNNIGEESFPGLLINEPNRTSRYRKGLYTTRGNKITCCNQLKILIENDSLKIKSKLLVHQLKNYISQYGSYSAKSGEKDDLISSTLIFIRIFLILSNYDEELHNIMKGLYIEDTENDPIEPLPLLF